MKLVNGKRSQLLEYLMIIAGTGLMALAINSVFDASGMVTGGFSGIAILVKAWTKGLYGNGIPLWITNLILNVPLFLYYCFICYKVTKISTYKQRKPILLSSIMGVIKISTIFTDSWYFWKSY